MDIHYIIYEIRNRSTNHRFIMICDIWPGVFGVVVGRWHIGNLDGNSSVDVTTNGIDGVGLQWTRSGADSTNHFTNVSGEGWFQRITCHMFNSRNLRVESVTFVPEKN